MNFAKSSADGPTRTNMVSVSRTHVSGESDNLHKNPSTRRPWVAAQPVPAIVGDDGSGDGRGDDRSQLSSPRAASAPATASSGEAGIGSPPSSSRTVKEDASKAELFDQSGQHDPSVKRSRRGPESNFHPFRTIAAGAGRGNEDLPCDSGRLAFPAASPV